MDEETKELLLNGLEALSKEVETQLNGFAERLTELERLCAGLVSELQQIRSS